MWLSVNLRPRRVSPYAWRVRCVMCLTFIIVRTSFRMLRPWRGCGARLCARLLALNLLRCVERAASLLCLTGLLAARASWVPLALRSSPTACVCPGSWLQVFRVVSPAAPVPFLFMRVRLPTGWPPRCSSGLSSVRDRAWGTLASCSSGRAAAGTNWLRALGGLRGSSSCPR